MRKGIANLVTGCVIVAICLWLSAPGAFGQDAVSPCPLPDLPTCKERLTDFWHNLYADTKVPKLCKQYKWNLLAKAQPDECFQGVGNPYNLNDPSTGLGFFNNYPGDLTSEQIHNCLRIQLPEEATPTGYGEPKTNQAYVWGLVQARDKCNKPLKELWFGTIANTHCLVISGFLGETSPIMNPSYVCEGSQSQLRDSRPPRAYFYCTKSKKLIEVTDDIIAGGCFPPDTVTDQQLLLSTVGLRSAGSARGVVFLGGIGARGGVNLFAFDACTKKYLGARNFPGYNNIRQWRLVKGQLYVGMGKRDGGEVLRWTGKKSCIPDELFCFELVGDLVGPIAGDPAYLTEHECRLYVSTWPSSLSGGQNPRPMSILRSPLFGGDKMLTSTDASGWEEVWNYGEYDPEASLVYTTGGGALMSYKGCLYWGTMHVPGLSLLAWNQIYGGSASQEDAQAALLGTYRPISIFRGCCLGDPAKAKVELLYGFSCLPVYEPLDGGWRLARNNMDQDPKYGLGGFNNFFNNYTWWAEVFKDKLFFGTMDFLYLGAASVRDEYEFPEKITQLFELFYGADLWVFPAKNHKADPVSRSGVGNYANYGIRTMVSTDSALYLGSANPMNLMTDRYDDRPEGGWELIKLLAK